MSNAVNPYAAPAALVDDVPANPEADAIRRAHINHEASIKAVGFLYYLGGVLLTVGGIASLVGAPRAAAGAAIALLLVVVGIGQLFAGWGVRSLRPWGRIVGCVLSAIGLLGFPIGTLISGYILYLLLSKKGRTIFTPGYQEVIAATPHVKYRTSIVVWIFLALIVGLILFAAFGAFFGR
jgi:uncharacterized membrane protein YphA (DoxX/SURF4 family)